MYFVHGLMSRFARSSSAPTITSIPAARRRSDAAALHVRVRVPTTEFDAPRRDAGLDDRFYARPRATHVVAGLERDVERAAFGPLARRLERDDLRVRIAGHVVEALADDLVGSGGDQSAPTCGFGDGSPPLPELERSAH